MASSVATFGVVNPNEFESFTASVAGVPVVTFNFNAIFTGGIASIVPLSGDYFGMQPASPTSSDTDFFFEVLNGSTVFPAQGIAFSGLAAPFGFSGATPGTFGTYPGAGGTCGTSMATGTSCVVAVRFHPTDGTFMSALRSMGPPLPRSIPPGVPRDASPLSAYAPTFCPAFGAPFKVGLSLRRYDSPSMTRS